MLVGQNGSGKSNVLMNSIIARMQAGHDIHMVDQKNEFAQIFENHINIYKPDQTVEIVRKLTQAAKDRMDHFGLVARQMKRPIRDIWEYEKVTGKKLPIIWLILEELILVTEQIDQKELTELFVAGRSSGVFVYAACQHLTTETLSSSSSVNILNKVYMGNPKPRNMQTLFKTEISKEIYSKANTFLGKPGKGLYLNEIDNSFTFIEFPRVDEEMLVSLMQ